MTEPIKVLRCRCAGGHCVCEFSDKGNGCKRGARLARVYLALPAEEFRKMERKAAAYDKRHAEYWGDQENKQEGRG